MSRKQQYSASITIGSVLEQSVKKNIGVLKSGLNQVGDSIREVERRQKELAKQRRVLEREGKSVESLDREYEQLERRLKDLRRAQQRWNDAAKASSRVGSTFRDMRTEVGRTSRRIAVGASLAGGAVFGLAASTASLGDDVAKTADKLGIGITELQELRYAAERSGVATGAFDTALEKMQKNLGEAAGGTGAAKDALEQLGLSASDLIELSPDQALGLIADRMGEVGTDAERAAILTDIFGRSGVGMINMLRGGSKSLLQLQQDARRTGYVLSEKAARDAEIFQDTLLDTQLVMIGLKNTVGAELMPVVTQAVRQIGDALVDNREDVQRWAKGFADGVERALPVIGEVLKGISQVSMVVSEVITKTAEMVGGWENFGIIIGAVLAGKTVLTVVKFGGAVFQLGRALWGLSTVTPIVATGIKAIGSALIANPIGLAVAAIAGAAILIYKNWDSVGPWFNDLWGGIKNVFKGFVEFVGGVFTADLSRAKDGLVTIWDGVKAYYGTIFKGIGAEMELAYTSVIRPVMDALGVTGPIESAWASLQSKIGIVVDWIGQKFEWLIGKVQPVIDRLQWIQGAGAAVADSVGSWFGGDETSSSAANKDQAPAGVGPNRRFAMGGAFTKGPIMVGEKGPELRFENKAGFIANNRASRQLADRAHRVDAMLSKPVAAVKPGGAGGGGVVQNITIDAKGMSPQELVRELERYQRQAAGNGLYDRVSAAGPMGR